jgi:hypothetical protein
LVAVAQPPAGRSPDHVRVDVVGVPGGGAGDAEIPVLAHDREVGGQADEAAHARVVAPHRHRAEALAQRFGPQPQAHRAPQGGHSRLSVKPARGTKMVSIIDGMEAEGLVSRRPDPDDRRARIIEPTAEGRKRLRGARAAIRRMEDDFLADLPAARRATLVAALRDLAGEPLTRLTATS